MYICMLLYPSSEDVQSSEDTNMTCYTVKAYTLPENNESIDSIICTHKIDRFFSRLCVWIVGQLVGWLVG